MIDHNDECAKTPPDASPERSTEENGFVTGLLRTVDRKHDELVVRYLRVMQERNALQAQLATEQRYIAKLEEEIRVATKIREGFDAWLQCQQPKRDRRQNSRPDMDRYTGGKAQF